MGKRNEHGERDKCYSCFRPQSSCMCEHVTSIDTRTQFIILMHPKERQKIKNNTGYLTHLSLKNSKIIEGVDFTHNSYINHLIATKSCYILYPDTHALDVLHVKRESNVEVIIIIDSTWILSKKMLKLSTNLQVLPKISFRTAKTSQYKIKQQPDSYCLSTIESTYEILHHLNRNGVEDISLENFLRPFDKMIEYQLSCLNERRVRLKKY